MTYTTHLYLISILDTILVTEMSSSRSTGSIPGSRSRKGDPQQNQNGMTGTALTQFLTESSIASGPEPNEHKRTLIYDSLSRIIGQPFQLIPRTYWFLNLLM